MWVLMNALCKPSLGVRDHATKILQAENVQKVNEFEPIYLDNYRYWCKMICDFLSTLSTTFLLVMFVYPNLKTIFFYFFFYF